MLDYAAATTLIVQRLQSTGTADYSVSEIDNALTYALDELGRYHPHTVPITFKLESRRGTDTVAAASSVTDTVKGQFLSTDPTDEKVIHNITRNTYAVALTQSSTSVITVGMNLMTANDEYRVYNKQCWNERQIYIGDVPNYDQIDSVEYPIGMKRNWKRTGKILELDINRVPDSNANTAIVNIPYNVNCMVRFQQPHALPNLTDWTATLSATAATGATTLSATALQSAGTISTGAEFTIENHRLTYVVANSATIASNTVAISFYPPLEAPVSSTAWVLTFEKTSLEPQYEDVVADIAVGRAMINRAPEFVNAINIGGGQVYQNFLATGQTKLADAQARLRKSVPPKTTRRFPTDV